MATPTTTAVDALMAANALIEVAWVAATVCLVLTGHPVWAVATYIGAFLCGYSEDVAA